MSYSITTHDSVSLFVLFIKAHSFRGNLGTLEIKMSVNQGADIGCVVGISDERLPDALI